jgi:hypothetical protein
LCPLATHCGYRRHRSASDPLRTFGAALVWPHMTSFVAHNSRWRIALLTLCCLGFVVGGLWMAGVLGDAPQSDRYPAFVFIGFGWLNVVIFGTCAGYGVKSFFDGAAQLEIGPAGIRWVPWSRDLIPWSQIKDVTTWSHKQQKYIVLHLDDPGRFPGRGLAGKSVRVDKMMTGGDIAFSMAPTDRSYSEAIAAIAAFRQSAR